VFGLILTLHKLAAKVTDRADTDRRVLGSMGNLILHAGSFFSHTLYIAHAVTE